MPYRCRVCDQAIAIPGKCPRCVTQGYYAPSPEEIDDLRREILRGHEPNAIIPSYYFEQEDEPCLESSRSC